MFSVYESPTYHDYFIESMTIENGCFDDYFDSIFEAQVACNIMNGKY